MRVHEKTDFNKIEYLKSSVGGRIESVLSTVEPQTLRAAMAHGCFGGKMVRPLLTMLSCEAVGGRTSAALEAAAAIELLHSSSLIHDDIMDASPLRRGRTTVHKEFGIPLAILSGDAFIALAFQLVQNFHSPNKEQILTVFTDSFRHVCEGQGYDLHLTHMNRAGRDAHRTMVEKKTAKLFEAATITGALCGTINREHVDALASFGFNIGMAFQAQDDLLDATGSELRLGKPVALDAKNGRGTYLSLIYPSHESSQHFEDAVAATTNLVESHTGNACRALDLLPSSESLNSLRLLAKSLVNRKD